MSDTTIDMSAIEAQVAEQLAGKSLEELQKMVVEARVKQRINTQKYYNPETAKASRQKRSAFLKAAAAELERAGLMDRVKAEVDARVAEDTSDE